MKELDVVAALRAASKEEAQSWVFPGHRLFRHLFVPFYLALVFAPWVHHRESGQLFICAVDTVTAGATTLLLSVLVVWLAEQLYPARPEWNIRPFSDGAPWLLRLVQDAVYLFGVTELSALTIRAMDSHLKSVVARGRLGISTWPVAAPFAVKVVLAFLLVELASYWIHRAAHHFRPLWQFHSTHHVVIELNGLKALRTHPVDNLVFYLARTLPLMWLGAGLDEVAAALYVGGALGVLSHANVRVSDRIWGLFFNLPQVHAVHHSAELSESRANFGCHTVLWDRVFRTYQGKPHGELRVGIHPVGPRSLWQELAWPFYRDIHGGGPAGVS